MVKRISLFQTTDGSNFPTEKEAMEHEAKTLLEGGVNKLLTGLGLGVAVITVGEGEDIFLATWLLNNRQAVVAALTGTAKKERKPRAPKQPKEPKVKNSVTVETAGATPGHVAETVAATLAATETAKVVAEKPTPAHSPDDLTALLEESLPADDGNIVVEVEDAGQTADELLDELTK